MMKNLKWVSVAIIAFASILLYQNCSKNSFSSGTQGINNVSPLICEVGQPSSATDLYPTSCQTAPTFLPANAPGLDMFQVQGATLTLLADDQVNGIPIDKPLYIELATYQAPDTIIVNYTKDADPVDILNVCQISTYPAADSFTGLSHRPYSDSILQFETKVIPAGTKKITIDLTNALTANYVGIWNLGDFSGSLDAINKGTLLPVIVNSTAGICASNAGGDCKCVNLGDGNCYSQGKVYSLASQPAHYNDQVPLDQSQVAGSFYDPLPTNNHCPLP